jgi:16S rRNA (cytosine967-C5)-methyltransferase
MDNISQTNTLPEKVQRRHFEIVQEIIPDFTRLVVDEGRPVDVLLNHYLRNHRELGSRDRRFLSQAVFSYFRWYGWSVVRLGLEPVDACLLGVLLDSTGLHPSFEYARQRGALPATACPAGDLSIGEKGVRVAAWFPETLQDAPLLPEELFPPYFKDLVDSRIFEHGVTEFQQRAPVWLRTRTSAAALSQILDDHDIPNQAHPRMLNAVAIESGISLDHTLRDQAGQFVVQDISSQCVGQVCSPAEGEEWWDCCAGAGGKALQLMDLMHQQGRVLATDTRIDALKELKKRARHYGIRNIRTQPFNAVSDEPFTKTFDGVLVDAPCSGWGTWGRNPDARWRASQRDVIQCATRQLKILSNAKWCVKPGGTLVYAVCTLTRPETEEVVMKFLDAHPDFRLAPFPDPLTGQPTDGQLQVWPWDGPGDAMFIARFVRQNG